MDKIFPHATPSAYSEAGLALSYLKDPTLFNGSGGWRPAETIDSEGGFFSAYDRINLEYVPSGNGEGQYSKVEYQKNGEVLLAVNFLYDPENKITGVYRS